MSDDELNKILERKYKELTKPREVRHLTKADFDDFIKDHEVAWWTSGLPGVLPASCWSQ